MGGRRASSISEIVGSGSRLAPLSQRFGRAVAAENPHQVAAAAANLLATGPKSTDILYYAVQLTGFIRRIVESEQDLPYEKREALAREEWSKIKAREGLPDDAITTNAIVSAAARAIALQKK
jgi:hypothetical protein